MSQFSSVSAGRVCPALRRLFAFGGARLMFRLMLEYLRLSIRQGSKVRYDDSTPTVLVCIENAPTCTPYIIILLVHSLDEGISVAIYEDDFEHE